MSVALEQCLDFDLPDQTGDTQLPGNLSRGYSAVAELDLVVTAEQDLFA